MMTGMGMPNAPTTILDASRPPWLKPLRLFCQGLSVDSSWLCSDPPVTWGPGLGYQSRIDLLLHTELPAQCLATAREARAYSPDGHRQDFRCVLVAEAFKTNEQDDLSLFGRQLPQRTLQLVQLTRGSGVGGGDQ